MFDAPTIRLYHGTSAEYDEVDPDMLAADPDAAPNCALGLWLTPDAELAGRFGSRILTFEVPTDAVATIGIDELSRLHSASLRDEDFGRRRHADYAERLRSDGHTLLLVMETDGTWGTAVAVDPRVARIVDVRRSPWFEPEEPRQPAFAM